MQFHDIGVKGIFSPVKCQVAGQMDDQKAAETESGNGLHQFFPDGRAKGTYKPVHIFLRCFFIETFAKRSFWPNFCVRLKFNPQNAKYILVVKIFAFLEREQK